MRDKIVYLPFPIKGNKINEYTTNMVKILQEKYDVYGNLAETTDILQMLRTKAIFLNWIEEQLDFKMKLQLLLYKLFGTKIVWVFHNKYPHDIEKSDVVIANMKWLARYSSVILLHSKSSRRYIPNGYVNIKKAIYVPHILYEAQNRNADIKSVRERYGLKEDDFVFTMFGAVRPYKNVEGCIKAFDSLKMKNAKLLIVGKPVSKEYAHEIEILCRKNKNIVLDLKYITNVMLDNIIDCSDVIVMPYKDGSSMNSGVMIQSFSKGKTVISPDICMAKDMARYKFFYMYRKSLSQIMLKAYQNGKYVNAEMGERARQYIQQNNCKKEVRNKLNKIL